MLTRRSFTALATGSVVAATAGCAHQPEPKPFARVGFLIGSGFEGLSSAFRGELDRLGYREGINLVLEARVSPPNTRDGALQAAELAGLNLDVIVAGALPYALELKRLGTQTPVVIATGPGLVSNGLVQSLDHPGGNFTGMDELPPGVTGMRLRFLKTAAPSISRVALLSTTPGQGGHETQLADAQAAAPSLGITVHPYRAANMLEVEAALARLVADGMEGLLSFQGGLALVNRALIADFARRHRLPAIYQSRLFVEAGGLMSYAPDQEEQYREAARYADKILKGAHPADLPVRHPERYFLSINRSAAQAIGLILPPALLARADHLI